MLVEKLEKFTIQDERESNSGRRNRRAEYCTVFYCGSSIAADAVELLTSFTATFLFICGISTAAAAVEDATVDEQNCVLFSIAAHLLRRRSAAAAPRRTS